jgi:hypothetical protein
MEKIFQILSVFALLMLVITYSVKAKEKKFRDYIFSGRFTFPLSGDLSRQLIAASVVMGDEIVPVAADRENQLSFRGGQGRTLEVADEQTGRIIAAVSLETGADAVLFDPASRLIYCCSLDGALTIIRQMGRERYKIVQYLIVPDAFTGLAVDPQTGKLYVQAGGFVSVYSNA